jgi:type II secretion system protein L
VHRAGTYVWRDCTSRAARNLLGSSSEFAPPRSTGEGWSSLRPAAVLALLTLLLYSAFSFGEWAWLDHQKTHLRQQMFDRFRAAFPQVQTVVDPALQMQRLHDQLRRERGQLGYTDFLPLLAATSEAAHGQGQLRSLGFEDGRLEMTIVLADAAAVDRLRETLARRGLGVALRDSHPAAGKGGIEAIFTVRSAP